VTIPSSHPGADVLVIGAGLIGLACAAAAAERGLAVLVVGHERKGQASLAAAGILAPSIERATASADAFGIAARDRYPAYIEWLAERCGTSVSLNRDGIIQVAVTEAGVRGLRRAMSAEARWLDAAELHALEPGLKHGLGGVFHEHDGAVDNVQLYEALYAVVRADRRITMVDDAVTEMAFTNSAQATGRHGSVYRADRAVVAAGAWSNTVRGLPRAIPVEPVRGQMIAYPGRPLSRVVYGPTGYIVPRSTGRTLVGATTEHVGFDSVTTPEGIERLRRTAAEILPELADLEPSESWSGLRPMSSDLHPVLGVDPDEPRLIYATGHSRNGVLMTPLTGDCIAALLCGDALPVDIEAFSIARFAGRED
jgi:glycine oxidase